jgi:hypothetical protein
VHFVALGQQEFRKIGAVLSGDTGDERFFHYVVFPGKEATKLRRWHPPAHSNA